MSAGRQAALAFIEYWGIFTGFAACLLLRWETKAPKMYMDEVFHVPQTQKYCQENYKEWDSMITTLPGLYIVTVAIFRAVQFLFGYPMDLMCTVFWMRSVNVGFSCINSALFYLIYRKIHSTSPAKQVLNAVAIGLLPILYFFSFLFYTDSGSTCLVMLCYLSSLYGRHRSAALVGALSVVFRQTNIIWVMFIGAQSVCHKLETFSRDSDSPAAVTDSELVKAFLLKIWKQLRQREIKPLVNFISEILFQVRHFIFVLIGFMVFVYVNNGIVVGAKTDHQACLHLPQIFYFAGLTFVFNFMHILPHIPRFLRAVGKHYVITAMCLLLAYMAVEHYTYQHRYLLADNRHYTFYVWSKIYRRHELIPYLLIPGYLFIIHSMNNSLHTQNIFWRMLFWISVLVSIVPQKLLEFRYFILPFLFYRLNSRGSSIPQVILEIAVFIGVNAGTIYMFLERPFYWPNSVDKQRFMW